MSVLDDTCGYHDTLAGCCSCEIDKVRYGVEKTESGRTNFIAELGKWAMAPSEIVSNINFFMRVPFTANGEVVIADGVSKAGDYVLLRAEMPVIVVISELSAATQSRRRIFAHARRGRCEPGVAEEGDETGLRGHAKLSMMVLQVKNMICLKGGRVICPASGIDGNYDVAIRDGRIAACGTQHRSGRIPSLSSMSPASLCCQV